MMLQAMPGAMLGGCSKQCTQRTQRTNATNARISHHTQTPHVLNRARVSSPDWGQRMSAEEIDAIVGMVRDWTPAQVRRYPERAHEVMNRLCDIIETGEVFS